MSPVLAEKKLREIRLEVSRVSGRLSSVKIDLSSQTILTFLISDSHQSAPVTLVRLTPASQPMAPPPTQLPTPTLGDVVVGVTTRRSTRSSARFVTEEEVVPVQISVDHQELSIVAAQQAANPILMLDQDQVRNHSFKSCPTHLGTIDQGA